MAAPLAEKVGKISGSNIKLSISLIKDLPNFSTKCGQDVIYSVAASPNQINPVRKMNIRWKHELTQQEKNETCNKNITIYISNISLTLTQAYFKLKLDQGMFGIGKETLFQYQRGDFENEFKLY